MTRKEIEQIYVEEPNCFETDREEQWYKVGLKEGLAAADQCPAWVSVEERLPPKMGKYSKRSDEVLVITERKERFIAKYWYDGDGWAVSGFPTSKLTHWMPIIMPKGGDE